MKEKMKWIYTAMALVSLALMAIPGSVKMNWMPSQDVVHTTYHTYFEGIVFGYGNWFCPLSALFTLINLFRGVFRWENGKQYYTFLMLAIFSFGAFAMGGGTVLGGLIFVLHLIGWIITQRCRAKE